MRVLTLLLMLLFAPQAVGAEDLSVFSYDQHLGDQVPLSATFRDQQGDVVTLGQSLGHLPTILVLGYFHCPNLCGLVRADLMNALTRLGGDQPYSLVVLSIDPSETPAEARMAWSGDAERPARYLTGPESEIRAVSDAVGLRSRFNAEQKQFLHPAGLVFLTGDGVVSGYLLGLGYQPGDVALALARAANGVTARALPVLLLCFHYDAVTGRYTLEIMRILRLGAAITALVVGGTVMLALRRERRPR